MAVAAAETPECVLLAWGFVSASRSPAQRYFCCCISIPVSFLGNRCAKYGVRRDYAGHEAVLVAVPPLFLVSVGLGVAVQLDGSTGMAFWGASRGSKVYMSGKQCFQGGTPAVNKTGVGID